MATTKIAHVLNAVGGVDMWLRINLKALDSDLITAVIIRGEEGPTTPYLNNNGIKVPQHTVSIRREINFFKDLKAIIQTIKLLKKEKPDVIHAHSAKGGIIARAASLFYPVKVLYTPHAFSYLSAESNFKKRLYIIVERIFKRFNSIVLACSVSERRRAIQDLNYKPSNALVFNNCIAPVDISEIRESNIISATNYICTVGRPSYQKNIEHLVEVIKELKERQPSIHLVILGVGEYSPNKENVEKLIAQCQLKDHITMIPWIAREEIFNIVNKSQLYVSAARYEGLPYSVIEAMAMSKACVVTDCDGNRDLIVDGENGYVVPQDEVKTMANRIFDLLEDKDRKKKMEAKALLFFNTAYNINNNIHKLEAIYKEYSKIR